jgi:hypothetical protein
MSAGTLAQARAELAALVCSDLTNFTPVPALAGLGVVAVYPSEPVSPLKPLSVTIWVTGFDPNEFTYEVRVYRSLDSDVIKAQQDFDAVVWMVDRLIGATGRYGPSAWTMGTNGEQDGLLAFCRLTRGREDF